MIKTPYFVLLSSVFLNLTYCSLLEASMTKDDREVTRAKTKNQTLILEHLPEGTFIPPSHKRENASVEEEEGTLNLARKKLNDDTIKIAMENVLMTPLKEEIKKLNLRSNKIGDLGAINIASALDFLPKLQELDVTKNPLTSFGLQILLTKIQAHPNKSIEFLYSGNPEENRQLEDRFKIVVEPVSSDSSDFKIRVSHE